MPAPTLHPAYCVVVNTAQQKSIWPEYRRKQLPTGWSFTGFEGPKDDCLAHIAAGAATPTTPDTSSAARRISPPAAGPRATPVRLTTALPFPQPQAPRRLIVFPHAGSGASYYHFLARRLKTDPLEVHIVQYPGREMRMRETPLDRMDRMVALLAEELGELIHERPCAFFGHSMGALAAFELTRALHQAGATLPEHLFLSGRQAPSLPGHHLEVDRLDDEALLEAVGARYNALPSELLAHREILELILPSLRADFSLMEKYVYRREPPLPVRATLLNGTEDLWVRPGSLAPWQDEFAPRVAERTFPGGHFYLSTVVDALRTEILAALPPP